MAKRKTAVEAEDFPPVSRNPREGLTGYDTRPNEGCFGNKLGPDPYNLGEDFAARAAERRGLVTKVATRFTLPVADPDGDERAFIGKATVSAKPGESQ